MPLDVMYNLKNFIFIPNFFIPCCYCFTSQSTSIIHIFRSFFLLFLSFIFVHKYVYVSDRYFNISSLARYQILFLHKHQKLISKEHLVNALLPSFLRFRFSVLAFNFPKKHIFRNRRILFLLIS